MTSESENPIEAKEPGADEGERKVAGKADGEAASTSPAVADPASAGAAATGAERPTETKGPTGRPFDPTRPFERRSPLPAKPRRVRGGVKLSRGELDYNDSPTAARWLELAIAKMKPAMRDEAIEYARSGQAKRIELGPGRVSAPVQGRMPGAYKTSLKFDTLSKEQWGALIDAMGAQAKFAATLIAGHLTADLIGLFESLDSPLIPAAIEPACTCAERREAYEAANPGALPAASAPPTDQGGWCKHSVCLALLVADRLASEPLAILQLRGMPASEVMERLHEIRTAHTAPGPPVPVYTPVVKGASDVAYPPLEACLGDFWSPPTDPRELDFPVVEPEVSHPLLRRLGPSPFQDGQFPLVGLLASCYDSISEAILREEREGRPDEMEDGDLEDELGGLDDQDGDPLETTSSAENERED
jgi:uncharacterized Zn finger protein